MNQADKNQISKRTSRPGAGVSSLTVIGLSASLASLPYQWIIIWIMLYGSRFLSFGSLTTLGLLGLPPTVAVILSFLGLRRAGDSDLSRQLALVGLVIGLISLLPVIAFAYNIWLSIPLID